MDKVLNWFFAIVFAVSAYMVLCFLSIFFLQYFSISLGLFGLFAMLACIILVCGYLAGRTTGTIFSAVATGLISVVFIIGSDYLIRIYVVGTYVSFHLNTVFVALMALFICCGGILGSLHTKRISEGKPLSHLLRRMRYSGQSDSDDTTKSSTPPSPESPS